MSDGRTRSAAASDGPSILPCSSPIPARTITECQEFYGAITLNSEEPLGRQIVTMLDVAARGFGSKWEEVIIPEFDYVLVEKTLGKFGREVEVFNDLPIRLQHLVGSGY